MHEGGGSGKAVHICPIKWRHISEGRGVHKVMMLELHVK
jgi:hypothetical protein